MKPASLLPFLLLAGAFWLLVIRPSQKQRAAKASLVESLRPGVEIVTTAGLRGTVVALDGDDIVLEIAEGVQVRFLRTAVGAVRSAQSPDDADPESDGPDSTDSTDSADGTSTDAEDPHHPALTDSSDPSEPTT